MTDSVGPVHKLKNVAHMNAIGWIMAVGIGLLLLPLLPFLAILWVLGQVGASDRNRSSGDIEREIESA